MAEIVTACEYLLAHPEIPAPGRGRRASPPTRRWARAPTTLIRQSFPARVAYTVDGGELGEIEYENFNAAAVTLTVAAA